MPTIQNSAFKVPLTDRIGPAAPLPGSSGSPKTGQTGAVGPTFAEALRQAELVRKPEGAAPSAPLKFSAHAQTRMQSRQIPWGPAEMERLEGAVKRAAGKGARESLVLLDQTALVVSVPNKTV